MLEKSANGTGCDSTVTHLRRIFRDPFCEKSVPVFRSSLDPSRRESAHRMVENAPEDVQRHLAEFLDTTSLFTTATLSRRLFGVFHPQLERRARMHEHLLVIREISNAPVFAPYGINATMRDHPLGGRVRVLPHVAILGRGQILFASVNARQVIIDIPSEMPFHTRIECFFGALRDRGWTSCIVTFTYGASTRKDELFERIRAYATIALARDGA